jgi:cephalosporin hydroxylase
MPLTPTVRDDANRNQIMRLNIDLDEGQIDLTSQDGVVRTLSLDEPESFEALSRVWLRVGWVLKYTYGFTWFGRPVIQLPEDLVRLQELIYELKPDVIVEIGVAHGGSVVFYASLCAALEHGHVVGVDVEIRPHNRTALESHPLRPWFTLVEGDSVAPPVVDRVRGLVGEGRALVVLDSAHTKAHVLAELNAYAPLVSVGSFVLVADGIMADLVGATGAGPDWEWNNPRAAVAEFVASRNDFVLEQPTFRFNEGSARSWVTHWPDGWLRRVR